VGWPITLTETLADGTTIDKMCVTPCDEHYQPGATVTVTEGLPEGWTVSYLDVDGYVMTAAISVDVTFGPGEMVRAVTFGNWEESEKSGTKFHDLNANGVWDDGEPGLEGWTMFVDYDGSGTKDAGEPYDVTDANGDYTITGIKPGTFQIYEILLSEAWVCSYPNPGTPDAITGAVMSTDCSHEETFTSGSAFADNDFGNWTTTSKSGHKWEDKDGDGVYPPEAEDVPLAGWLIYVDYADDGFTDPSEDGCTGEEGEDPCDETDETGAYQITGIVPGTWKVKEEDRGPAVLGFEPFGERYYYCSYPNAGEGDRVIIGGDQFLVFSSACYHEETFESGDALTGNDFMNWDPLFKQGTKFWDQNKNGVYDDGEPGMAGFTFFVDYNDNGQLDDEDGVNCSGLTCEPSDVSDEFGTYRIEEILPGTWKIREVQDPDYVCVFPATTDAYGCYYLETFVSGEDKYGNNFGNRAVEGCTPGYWKQEQHFDSWVGWVPTQPLTDMFVAIIGSELFDLMMKQESGAPNVKLGLATLDQALEFPNDYGIGQMFRHGVAAVLNAANPDVAFGYSVVQIQDLVNGAIETGIGFEGLADDFMNANEAICPLN
jgi:hypothetical protein